jgi:ABC-type dipeptide/oligopeptide/nickel transport system ATPase subunit
MDRLAEVQVKILRLESESEILRRVSDLFRFLVDREVIDNATTAQDLLTEGLQAVFDDLDISVRAGVDIQRGKVSVDLVTIQKQNDGTITEGSIMDSYGGSVATVQSVLLRIVVLSRRGLRPLLLLDESLSAVAEDYVPRVGRFLAVLAQRLNLDILAVSHNPVMVESANRAYRIQKKKGESSFKEIRTGRS